MIKVRFLKSKSDTVLQLLESKDFPSIESREDLNTVMFGIGKMLDKYSEQFVDSNVISSLVDTSIVDWSIIDLVSLQASLQFSGFKLLISEESQDDIEVKGNDIMYLCINNANLIEGILPISQYTIINSTTNKIDMVEIYKSLLTPDYFNVNKFGVNMVNDLLNTLSESYKLLSIYDNYSMQKLSTLTKLLKLEFYSIIL